MAAAHRGDQSAFSASRVQCFPSVEDQTWLLADRSSNRPLYQPPIIHILSLKAIDIGKSLCNHGASSVSSCQFFPSADFHTSRGGDSYELSHPPKIHMWPS